MLHQGGGRPEPISCSSPATTGCSGALLAPPPHPRLARPDAGFNGLETIWGLEGADVSCPKQGAFRPQPQTSRRPRHPIVPAEPTANATGTRCHPWVQKGLPWPCTHLPLTTKGITRLGWKPVYAQARKKAQRISGLLDCARHLAPRTQSLSPRGSTVPARLCAHPGRAQRAGGTRARG